MPTWGWILIAVAVVVALAVIAWTATRTRRSGQLREHFGPEYDRTVSEAGSKKEAEEELAGRHERRQQLNIHPLDRPTRDRYHDSWRMTQAAFVDDPAGAIAGADTLIQSVMRDRGYPVDDFEQRAADISVDYPAVVQHYREAHAISATNADGTASTEDLRVAMRHYRALFENLVETDEPAREEAPR